MARWSPNVNSVNFGVIKLFYGHHLSSKIRQANEVSMLLIRPLFHNNCKLGYPKNKKTSVPYKSRFQPQASRSIREYSYVLNMVSRLIPPICGSAVMGTGNVRVTAYENPKWTPTYTLISLNCSYKHIYSRHHHTNTSGLFYLIRPQHERGSCIIHKN